MNKEDKCEIAKDLAIQYIEKSLSKRSEDFVKEHLSECNDCREYYKLLENKIYNGNEQDKIIKKQFKKIHRKISILKIILIVILVIILVFSIGLWVKQEKFSNLVNQVSEKVEYMENLDNYKITSKTIQRDFNTNDYWEYEETYYYKDGKLKNESDNHISFKKDDSLDSIDVYHDLRQIEYIHHDNYIELKKGDPIGILSYVKDNYEYYTSSIYSLMFSIREDRFNGIECYVIRAGDKDSYRDVWIDKSTLITIREVNESYSNFYREQIYTFEENVVTEDDVSTDILNKEKYNDYNRINLEYEKTRIDVNEFYK